jgi:hypothetical protein
MGHKSQGEKGAYAQGVHDFRLYLNEKYLFELYLCSLYTSLSL